MSEIKNIGIIVLLIVIAACSKVNIPPAYNYKVSEVQNNPFGCWTEIEKNSTSIGSLFSTISGELITIEKDTLYLLIDDGKVEHLSKYAIVSAQLYTHKNQKGTYWTITSLLISPNIVGALVVPDAAAAFLLMALPTLIIGAVQAGIEGNSNNKSVLHYPGSSKIEDFKKFSRFPAGMPEDIDLSQLYLKKPNEPLSTLP